MNAKCRKRSANCWEAVHQQHRTFNESERRGVNFGKMSIAVKCKQEPSQYLILQETVVQSLVLARAAVLEI